MESVRGRLNGAGERRADHDRVGAAGDGLGDVAALAHAAISDDVYVDARLVEVAHARSRDVGDRRGLRTPMPSTARDVHALPGPTPTSTPAAPVRMRCSAGLVAGAPSHDDRHFELANELLQVESSAVLETCSAETTVP